MDRRNPLLHCLRANLWLALIMCAPLSHARETPITPEENVRLAEEAFDRSDVVTAMSYYRKAAEAGHVPAMSRLAYLLDKSEEDEEAVEWLKKSVRHGDAEGQFELARMYAYGEGIEQDNKQAFELFKHAANQLYAPAIRVLALAYETGDLGLRVDYELAQQWLKRGQLANDYWSIHRLARAYRNGELGLRIDKHKASLLEQQLDSTPGGQDR